MAACAACCEASTPTMTGLLETDVLMVSSLDLGAEHDGPLQSRGYAGPLPETGFLF
jgi:hypothetical protein